MLVTVAARYTASEQGIVEDSNGMRCYMQGSPAMASGFSEVPSMQMELFYANSRYPACSNNPSIKGIRLFADSNCTDPVYPATISDLEGHFLTTHWSESPRDYNPCLRCSSMNFSISFHSPTPVLCAIVQSTPVFAQGWQIFAGRGTYPFATSQFSAVTYGGVDVRLAAGSTVVFWGSFTVSYQSDFSTESLAVAMAKILFVPLHSVQLSRSRRLSRRLSGTAYCAFTVQFVDSTGALHKSVEATLKAWT